MKNLLRLMAALGVLAANGLLAAFGPAAPLDQAAVLLDRMTPEERVGQLFLVTFDGSQARSAIADLIQNYHVSGVVLQARRGNFADPPESVQAARSLTEALQRLEYDGSLTESLTMADGPALKRPEYVPLLIAVGEDGSGRSVADSMPGLSSMASEMAVGATWNLDLARDAGQVLGRELEAIGVNLLLGPALDVVEDPRLAAGSDLGVSAFGGDPFWVGEMGRAYVGGVRAGSGGRLAVVAKHFPGLGGSDRPLQDEVATVRKSLEQLRSIELAPFAAVASGTPGTDSSVVDGLLTAHIRYQGFQGNIRATTRPVSLDPQALSQILALEPLASWRQGGGVTVSDSLGSRALRRFRDPREVTFEGHLVARDALLAGNDLLFLADFQGSADPDAMTTIRNTMRFFAQRYQEDAVFAQRVDDAVLRILRLKLRLYGGAFDLERVVPSISKMEGVGDGVPVAFEIAQAAATLLTPSGDLPEALGDSPSLGERVVFFSDVRTPAVCPSCPSHLQLDARAMEEAVLRLYGPRAAGQVESWHLASFTLADLAAYLGEPVPPNPALTILSRDVTEQALQAADWLVFAVLNTGEDAFGANALNLFLNRRPDLARAKRVLVFALDVPYDLDSTEISQLDVFYALFDQSAPFIDVAARLLFQELTAPGASPVSVAGIGYDLIEAMQPDPDQIIGLTTGGQNGGSEGGTPEVEGFVVGDFISVSTSVVRDANGHPVPDGTPVDFFLFYEDLSSVSVQATTVGGVAETELILDRLGLLRIGAESGPARTSEILELNVQEGVPAFITVIAPTPAPSVTVEPTGTVTGETPTPDAPTGSDGNPGNQTTPEAGWWGLLLGVMGSGLGVVAAFLAERRGGRSRDIQIRTALWASVGGLAVYNYLALGFPGSGWLLEALGPLAGFVAGAAGSAGGWWMSRAIQSRSSAVTPP